MIDQTLNFAIRPALIHDAIELWRPWIESMIGVNLEDAAIMEIRPNLAQIGVEEVLRVKHERVGSSKISRRLKNFFISAEIPQSAIPLLAHGRSESQLSFLGVVESAKRSRNRIEWQDCPVALKLNTVADPVVVMNVYYQPGPNAESEAEARLLVASRKSLEQVIRLLEILDARDTTPTLTTFRGRPRKIMPCEWDDLVLSPSVLSLLKNDFESFWDRQQWFQERKLPFRRGFLLHGAPGNGKSTAIRAMMTSRKLCAFTMRLYEPHTTDADLEDLFEEAMSRRPAIILWEDLDRAFPRNGQSNCQISLQALLNALDGVATGEGLVIVATANEPAALDPAILRRPGRFDRVIHFANPDRLLREQFFNKMKLEIDSIALGEAVANSRQFSFAQLREAVILATQFSNERKAELDGSDLLRGIELLRETMKIGSTYSSRAGFAPDQVKN